MNFEIYNSNGLVFWTAHEIKIRRHMEDTIADEIKRVLLKVNKSWDFHQIDAPLLMPREFVNPNYTDKDIWVQEKFNEEMELVLRPETTPSSYKYAQHILNAYETVPPLCVYQSGKSFRREQDQVSKNMRLKEFYQMEFQCIYASDTLADYQELILEPLRSYMGSLLMMEARLVESDRLPSYSVRTMDVEVNNMDKWMEICSISKRTDFPQKIKINYVEKKSGLQKSVEKDLVVMEVAIGLDRLVYNYMKRYHPHWKLATT